MAGATDRCGPTRRGGFVTGPVSDQDTFWQRTEAELAEIGRDIVVERDAFYSQPEWDVYRMGYSSSGGQRLFAWLSAPKGGGPFPALVRMPDYASVHDLIYTSLRHRAVVMNATHRGQRNSDAAVRASYPGLLTDGLDGSGPYTLLGAYADALAAFEALVSQDRVEIGTVAATGAGLGASLALAAAARRPRISAVAADTPMALGHPAALGPGLGYPLGELADYLRLYPDRSEAVEAILSVTGPLRVAASVSAPVLLSLGRYDRSVCPLAFGEELAAAMPHCDLRVYEGAAEGGGHEHAEIRTAWLADKLGLS